MLEPGRQFYDNWHLEAICDHLEAVSRGDISQLIINIPPRFMKSLAVSVFWPAWDWLRDPTIRWLFSSYGMDLSIRDSVKCRRLIQSSWYHNNWKDRYSLTGDQNAKQRFENSKTGYRIATSVDGTGTGEGGDRIVVDDPHSQKNALSDTVRKAALDWWDQTMSTRGNDPKKTRHVVVMQRLNEDDLSGYLRRQGGYEEVVIPMRFEERRSPTSIGWTDPRTEFGELLWPERFDNTYIGQLEKKLGSYGTAGQLQQRPSPASGGVFKQWWLRYWKPHNRPDLAAPLVRQPNGAYTQAELVELPDACDWQCQSWDMAFKDGSQNDSVSGQVWAGIEADWFLLERVNDKMDLPATLQSVIAMSARWPGSVAKYVEAKANGPAVMQMLQHKISGLIGVEVKDSKLARAHAVSPLFEAGNVYVPHPDLYSWVPEYVSQLCTFPNGSHDDDVDSTTQALSQTMPKAEQLAVITWDDRVNISPI